MEPPSHPTRLNRIGHKEVPPIRHGANSCSKWNRSCHRCHIIFVSAQIRTLTHTKQFSKELIDYLFIDPYRLFSVKTLFLDENT